MHQATPVRFVVFALTILTMSGCIAGTSATSSNSSSTGSSSGGGGGGSSGGNSTTYGMNCTSSNGADIVEDYPVMYVSSITGSTMSSVAFQMYLNGYGNSTTYNTSLTLNVYTCVTPGTTLTSAAATASVSAALNGNSSTVTFTFGSAVTLPTNCSAGEVALAFELVDNSGYASELYAASGVSSSSCFLDESTSTTEVESGRGRSYEAVITATQ